MWIALGLASLGILGAILYRGLTDNPGHPLGNDPRARRTTFRVW
jgi:hypothetical protein